MRDLFYIFCLGLLFIVAGVRKSFHFTSTTNGISSRFLFRMFPTFIHQMITLAVILLEIAAPIGMMYGLYNKDYSQLGLISCVSLMAFTLLASILYHNPVDPSQRTAFLKNMAIIGGLGCALSFYQ